MEILQGLKTSHNFRLAADAAPKKTKLKGRLILAQDFYRLAANLAKIDRESMGTASNDLLQEFKASIFLELSYQEKSQIFCAKGERWKDVASPAFFVFDHPRNDEGLCAELLDIAHNLDSLIFDEEHYMQPRMTALDFHEKLCEQLDNENKNPFVIVMSSPEGNQRFLVDQARLFSSNRMGLKTLQVKGGAQPSIRYFHCALKSTAHHETKHVVYWLKFSDQQQPLMGSFIEGSNELLCPKNLICPKEALAQLAGEALSPDLLSRYLQAIAEPNSCDKS